MTFRSKTALAGLALILASAFEGSTAVLHVPADYSTIQAAVNAAAASGDEIQIAAGVYTNQVLITNKNLTLSGSPGTVLRATPGMQLHDTLVSMLEISKSDVVVSGLTFEGDRLGDSQPGSFFGILFLAATGRVEDCRISGFRSESLTPTNWGIGVDVENPLVFGYGTADVQVLRSAFADNRTSIRLVGDTKSLSTTSINFAVNDNTIIGNGPDPTGFQCGVYIYAGAGGEVKRNTITDHAYTGTNNPNPYSFGILAFDNYDFNGKNALEALQPIQFEGNILRNNQIDLFLARGDGSTIVNNSFEGTAPGLRPTGLGFSGNNVLVGTNRFSDMDTGIRLIGNDPDYGTYLGIASNAVLTANSFCNVATNYVFEPLTTYDEQSTLGCQDPTLSVTKSVLLTWPYDIQGYSVESGPTPNGPWTTNSDATVFLQDGQNSVAAPEDSDHQYFRLVKQP